MRVHSSGGPRFTATVRSQRLSARWHPFLPCVVVVTAITGFVRLLLPAARGRPSALFFHISWKCDRLTHKSEVVGISSEGKNMIEEESIPKCRTNQLIRSSSQTPAAPAGNPKSQLLYLCVGKVVAHHSHQVNFLE